MAKWDGLEFYRCWQCPRVISVWDMREQLKAHGSVECPRCGGKKLRKTNLTLWEKLIQVAKHPAVWRWKNASYN